MKKITSIIAIFLSLMACTRNQEVDIPDSYGLSLIAKTEGQADSRTIVEDQVHVYWEPDDEIMVFSGDKAAKFTTNLTASSATATFKGTFGEKTWPEDMDLWAVYPYSEDAVFDGETITTTLPSEQVARPGSFGKDMNLSIAHSNSNTLQFYNVGGGVRFSVSEEGIKKIMFEGLGGELISGKVKIGFEEGFPVVQEVIMGSQFITLLPPTGSKTFEKDTWYYIVAIPESLEKGYKLRFYKDTDYARRVTEKAIKIKRSIYGNIEKADEGIEYEATITSFPETDDEIEEATTRISEITQSFQPILEMCSGLSSEQELSQTLANEIMKVDGVVSSGTTVSGNVFFLTRDSVYVNIPLGQFNKDSSTWGKGRGGRNSTHFVRSFDNERHKTKATLPGGKKALVLLPRYDEAMDKFQWSEYGVNIYAGYSSSLESCGYEVDSYYNNEATLSLFRGNNLEKYHIVYFNTHGDYNLMTARNGIPTTSFMTGSVITDRFGPLGIYDDIVKTFGFLSLCVWKDKVYYWITKQAIEHDNPSFNNTWIFAHACYSSYRGDVPEYCLANGAAGYSGFIEPAGKLGSAELVSSMLFAFSSGMSYENAEKWAKNNSFYQGTQLIVNDASIFKCDKRDDIDGFYLVNPTPFNLVSSVDGTSVSFSWEKHQTNGYYEYSLCIDGNRLGKQFFSNNDFSSCSATYTVTTPGEHTWYVIANLIINGKTEASYKSEDGHFTVVDTPSTEETLFSRIYGGKTYSVIRKNVSRADCRINGDGSHFYPCSFAVRVDDVSYDLPGSYYSYQEDRADSDLGPVMAVDTRTGDMRVFFIEKDDYQADKYSMRGHMFTISDGAISEQTIFTSDNFGWFPYFTWDSHQLVLNCFSFDQYFSITAAQFDNWALQKGDKIQPGDFSARQQANELILFYETATPWEGEIVLERKYKIWSSGDYKTNWEGKTSDNYAYPTIALVFDNDQSISVGYYNTYYWTSRSDRVFGIYIITGGQEQYVQPRIVDEWVKEKFVINGNGVVRYYTNDVFMGEWTFYLDLASAHSVRVVGNPYGWWYTHYHYMDDFSLKTPATSVSDNFNNGEIDLTIWEQPVNPDGVYEEDGYLHMIQKRTDEDFTIRSKSILIVN